MLYSKIEHFANTKPYVIFKGDKDNFLNSSKFRLINLKKCEIGIISKHYLKIIMAIFEEKVNYNSNGEICH